MTPLAEIAVNTPVVLGLGTLCTIILMLAGAVWRAANFLRDNKEELSALRRDLKEGWTLRDQERWALQLERENRSRNINLFVPNVEKARES